MNDALAKTFSLLQWIGLGVGLLLFSQGKGSHGVFILIISIVPLLRAIFSPSYRKQCRTLFKNSWNQLEIFSQNPKESRVPYKAVFLYATLPILFFSLINGISISSMDNYPTVAVAVSLIQEGNTELSEIAEKQICKPATATPYWLRCSPTGVYSAYPLGMLAFAGPVVLLSKILQGDISNPTVQWRLQKWAAAWLAGLSLALFFILSLYFVSPLSAWVTVLFLSLGSAILSSVSQGLWTQGGVVFGFLLAIFLELRFSRSKFALLLEGACLTLLFSCRLSSIALIIPFGIWLLFRSPVRAVFVALFGGLFYVPIAVYYWKIYGNFFGPQMQMGQSSGFSANPLEAFLGLLFSPSHGLLVYQPWVLLLLVFLSPQVRAHAASQLKGWQALFFFAILFHLAIVSLWPCWWGGACWGSRLLTETIPLFAFFILFPIDFLLQSKPVAKKAIFTLLVLSFLMHLPFLYFFAGRWTNDPVKGKIYLSEEARLWDWSDPPFLYPVLRSRYLLSQ